LIVDEDPTLAFWSVKGRCHDNQF